MKLIRKCFRRNIFKHGTLTLIYVLGITVVLLMLNTSISSLLVVLKRTLSHLTLSGSSGRHQQVNAGSPLGDLDKVKDRGETKVSDLENSHALWFNPRDCSIVDFLAGPDPTSCAAYEKSLVCGLQARKRDIMCSIFLSQNGLNDDRDCLIQTDDDKVPRIVYFVIFGHYPFQFLHYVSIMAAKRYVSPSALYVIGDEHPTGYWWKRMLRDNKGVRFVFRTRPEYINGQQVMFVHHASDLVRLQTLLLNGGIYLDTDMVVTRPLDSILNYNITMGLLDNVSGMGNAFIAAKRNSDFIREWYDSYNGYNRSEWGRNSLEVPRDMWHKNPNRLHMETDRLYNPNYYETDKLYKRWDFDWSQNYAIHVWTENKPVPRSEEEIQIANTTVAQVFRNALYGDPRPRWTSSVDSKMRQ